MALSDALRPAPKRGGKKGGPKKPAPPVDPKTLRSEMVGLMVDIARISKGRPRSWATSVTAASRAVAALDAQENPEAAFLERLGTPEEALAWIDRMRPAIAARVEQRKLALGALPPPEASEDE